MSDQVSIVATETGSTLAVSDVMRRVASGQTVSREDVEAMAWRVTGWQSDQDLVDQLLVVVDAYALAHCGGDLSVATLGPPIKVVPVVGTETVVLEPPGEAVSVAATAADPGESEMATCTKCGVEKPLTEYGKDSKRASGLKSQCRACVSLTRKRWRAGQGR